MSRQLRTYFVLGFVLFLQSYSGKLVEGSSPLQAERERGLSRLLSSPRPQATSQIQNSPKAAARLPKDVLPTHYALTLTPVIDENEIPPFLTVGLYEADGVVTITVTCIAPTVNITFHASENIKVAAARTTVTLKGGSTPIPIAGQTAVPENDFYVITMQNPLTLGVEYDVKVYFVAPVATDRIDGLYLSKYTPPGASDPSVIAVTQFAAKAARQAFPCFDEPWIKTSFDITIGRSENYTAISNSPWADSDNDTIPGSGWTYDRFETTVNMSTYLVAIVVSKYEYEEAEITLPGNKPVRIYGPEHMIVEKQGGVYTAKISAEVMNFYGDYFDVDYKMGKMDSAVIPDFYFGAMENWGLITYREIFLMYYEGETTETERARTSNIIAHESSHQWFGNLITCQWWNHVWLNEGFATYLSYIGSNHTDPEFEPLKGILNDVVQLALTADANPTQSHPIRNEDSIIEPMYDDINYEKGASIIRMMEGFLGPNTLRKGLQRFLKQYEFKSVVQDDLFYVLTAVAHEDGVIPEDLTIKDIMDTWTRQSGYPLIRVSKGFTSNTIQISQERFVAGLPPGDLDRNDLWYVPIATATQDDPDFSNHTPKFWIDKYTALTIQPHNVSTWILLNPDAMGFYRVLYDTSLFALIRTQLETNATVISPASRSQLIDDYFAMAFQGFVRIETAFEVTRYMEQEDELIVWDAFFTQLAPTLRMLSGTPGYGSFRAYILPKINAAIERLGFNQPSNEKGVNVLLRLQLLDWACALDLESCLEHSSELLDQWMTDVDTNPIPIDLRAVVYCAAVKNGGPTAMEFLLDRYQNASTEPKQKPLLLNALACAKEQFVLQALLDKTLEDPSEFSDADKVTLMQRTLQNSEGRPLVLNFIRAEFSKFINQGINATEFTEFFRTVGQTCKTDSEFKAIEHFIDAYETELEPIAEILSGTLDSIKANMDWMKSYYEPMHDWFTMQISN